MQNTILYKYLDSLSKPLLFWCQYCFILAMKYLSMNNQPYPVRPTLINMNVDKAHHCLFIISMNRFDGSCNTIKNPFEGVNLKLFSMMKGINESMTLAKHVS